jgi:hypothetical protein
VANGGFFTKSDDGMAASDHRRKHLVKGEMEEDAAWLEPKELVRGRISMRQRQPSLTQHGEGRKWRAGPELGCSHANEGVGVRHGQV